MKHDLLSGVTGYYYDILYSSNPLPMEKEFCALTRLSNMARGQNGRFIILIDNCNYMIIDCR